MTEQLLTFTAGQWRDASGPCYQTEYPADGTTVATLQAATADDVDEAVAIELARIAQQAGVPDGIVSVLPGKGSGVGDVKMSGTGREKGRLGILEYMSHKSYCWGLNVAPLAWSST